MCPLQLVGRWVPLDFLLLYTCPLQLLDYFGGVRRGSGRRGSAARRLPEAGLALLSPPSSPPEPRCQLGATLPDHLSLTLQLSSSPHPHLYYTRIPVKLLFYRPAYVSIPSLNRGLPECRHRTGSHLRCPNYPTQICGPDHLHSTVLCPRRPVPMPMYRSRHRYRYRFSSALLPRRVTDISLSLFLSQNRTYCCHGNVHNDRKTPICLFTSSHYFETVKGRTFLQYVLC